MEKGYAIEPEQQVNPEPDTTGDPVVRRPPHELAFAAAIRTARNEAKRTQAELAEQAGLPLWLLRHAERGRRALKLFEAAAIAQALDLSPDEPVKVSASATFEPSTMGRTRAPQGRNEEGQQHPYGTPSVPA
jgi:transcriptional regulator with XRE-family HTH domain